MNQLVHPRLPALARAATLPSEHRQRDVRRVQGIAWVLDSSLVDPLLGFLVPGVGDLAGSAAGLYVVGLAIRRRLPVVVIARMLLNLAIDSVVGLIPIVGDLFDLAYRAHSRNAALFVARHHRRHATARDWLIVAGAALAFVAAIVVPLYLVAQLLGWLF